MNMGLHNFPKDGVEYDYILTKSASSMSTLVERVNWLNFGSFMCGFRGPYQVFKNFQIEQKIFYSTPFTEGTRPAGGLSYEVFQLKRELGVLLFIFKFLLYMFKGNSLGAISLQYKNR